MTSFLKKAILSLMIAILWMPMTLHATGLGKSSDLLSQTASKTGIDTSAEVEDVVGAGIRTALTLVGLIFMVLMVYAGFLWMTSRGEETQVEKAKKIVYTSLVGLVLVVGAYAITVLVTSRLASGG